MWGLVSVTVTHDPDDPIPIYYVNIRAQRGTYDAWIVQNLPIFNDEEDGEEAADIDLRDLGIDNGTQVGSFDYVWTVSDTHAITQPAWENPQTAAVTNTVRNAWESVDEAPNPVTPGDAAEKLGAPAGHKKDGEVTKDSGARRVGGVQEDHNQCAAGAFARSFEWLNRKFKLGIVKGDPGEELPLSAQVAYQQMRDAGVGDRDANRTHSRERWLERKDTLVRIKTGKKITTKVIDIGNYLTYPLPARIPEAAKTGDDVAAWIQAELDKDEDVELWYTWDGGAHAVTITRVYRKGDHWYVKYRDDKHQGNNGEGDRRQKHAKLVPHAANTDVGFRTDKNRIRTVISESVTAKNMDRPGSDPGSDIPDPTGAWHELWPYYCNDWVCDEWRDNGSGVLDECDYLHMEKTQTGDSAWYHVERVTITITVTEKPLLELTSYLDYTGDDIAGTLSDPTETQWHEVYPQYCRLFNCVGWEDNGDGRLSASDQILLQDKETGEVKEYHVDAVSTNIEVVQEEPPCTTDDDCTHHDACVEYSCDPDGTCVYALSYHPETDCCDPSDGTVSPIDDGDPCTSDICDPGTGEVTHEPRASAH